jgi:hypothetical protein
MKRPTCTPDYSAPRRIITPEEARDSGFPVGTEVTATLSAEDLRDSGAIHFLDAGGRRARRPV